MVYYYNLTEEQKVLKNTIKQFAQQHIAPIAQELDAKEEFSNDLTDKMSKLGLLKITIDPKYGGLGLDYLSYIIIIEELSKVDSSQAATIAAHNSLGIEPIYTFGTDAQKQKYLYDLCNTAGLWAFALTESSSGSDAQNINTIAKYNSNTKEWIINGSKTWITNASCKLTKGITILAKTGLRSDNKPRLTCFLVPANTPGLIAKEIKGKMMWRATNTAELFFEDLRLKEDAILGEEGKGFKIMMKTLDKGRLSIAAMGLGLAKGVFNLSLKYARERNAFQKPIIQHQAIAFKIAEMATQIESAEALLYKACNTLISNQPFAKLSAMAKLYCAQVAEFCAKESQQIFGAYGLHKEYAIERHFRDAALLRIGEGTNEIQKIVISRYLEQSNGFE